MKKGRMALFCFQNHEKDGAPKMTGKAEEIRDMLARHGLGIVLKTHDGTDWMTRWDHGDRSIGGGRDVRARVHTVHHLRRQA